MGTFQDLRAPAGGFCLAGGGVKAKRRGTTAVLEVKLEKEKVPGFRGSDLIRASSSQGR